MAGLVAAIVLQAARTVLITLLSKAVHQATQTIDTKKAPRQKSRCLLVCFSTKLLVGGAGFEPATPTV
jgi:hypothetical protein